DVVERDVRLAQRADDGRRERAHVTARGELGNDAAIAAVHGVLRCNDARANRAVDEHRRGGVVARALDRQQLPGCATAVPTRAKPTCGARLPGAVWMARV